MLVSSDWRTRALLRAQLLEEGCSVRAYELLRDAFRAIGRTPFPPSLLIAELSGDDSANEMDQLSALARLLPVWVLASHSDVNEAVLGGRGFEMILFRPIGMSDLVDRVKSRLKRLSD
jgi:DNA-binding response OmpR family regulator